MSIYHHEQLCERAARWLRGTMRCNPVFNRNASCEEIPDAIGWTSAGMHAGSIVVECKASRADFYADLAKIRFWKHREQGWRYSYDRLTRQQAEEQGFDEVRTPRMGTRRYFMCAPGIITPELIASRHPDHGLLYVNGRRIQVVINAPKREVFDHYSEIRYLRFAIINGKKPIGDSTQQLALPTVMEASAQ